MLPYNYNIRWKHTLTPVPDPHGFTFVIYVMEMKKNSFKKVFLYYTKTYGNAKQI